MEHYGLDINIVIETGISIYDFNVKFLEWIKSNNWICCGSVYLVDEDGNKISENTYIDNIR